jgi:hypothetical protein
LVAREEIRDATEWGGAVGRGEHEQVGWAGLFESFLEGDGEVGAGGWYL